MTVGTRSERKTGLDAASAGFFGAESLLDWIEAIHRDADGSEVLTSFAQSLSGALDGAFVAISPFADYPRSLGGRHLTSAHEPRFEEVYFRLAPEGLPWLDLVTREVGRLIYVGDHFDEEAIRATRFYDEYMEPQGFLPVEVVGSYHEHGPDVAGMTWAVYGVRPFTEAEIEFCRRIDRHLAIAARRAAQLRQLRGSLDAYRHLGDRSPVGIVHLDSLGRTGWMNAAMRLILGLGDGLLLKDRVLTAERPSERGLFNTAVRALVERKPETRALGLARSPERRPLGVLTLPRPGATPLHPSETIGTLVVFDPELPKVPVEQLLPDLYGLSPGEAALAIAIASGATTAQFAKQTGRSVETVRSQLKAVFRKLGVKRQADVALVVSASGALFPFPEEESGS